ncbi:triose-phosphate isomerase [Mycoplasma iguanae]|uniref:Triosephosphate isomerase n=1 Tax=Mycoplasma iguanae TaxID=292461 RepID=A0ABY5R8R7_9MOLU|nr:triose-phosphate isomerase [Mycoplasma iguanae]UVD81893.1 triose-phosphate isomerase [Mycoplasma iguanae]
MKKIIFNWKLNMNYFTIRQFIENLEKPLDKNFIILPSYFGIFNLLSNSKGKIDISQVGVQNISANATGDFIGKVSFVEAREVGIDYILVNHPYILKNYIDEKNSHSINYKLKVLLENDFKPIICIGNELQEKVTDIEKVITNEVKKLFENIQLTNSNELIFVYMPYFYAANNVAIDNAEIERQVGIVKKVIKKQFGEFLSESKILVLYGGLFNKESNELPMIDGIFFDHWEDVEYIQKIIKNTKFGN